MEFEEKTLKRELKFKGHIFEVAVDEVLLPDGKTAGRELIFHKGAVAVLAITPEGKIIIVKQYRKAIEAVSYEIPAGKLEVGEAGDEMAAAARELEEETQYRGELKLIYEFTHPLVSVMKKLNSMWLQTSSLLKIHVRLTKMSFLKSMS